LTNLAAGHLQLGLLAVPPLIVLCLHELLVRQHRRPGPVGLGLGLLIVLQFFISTEVLVITAITLVVAGVLTVGYGWWRDRSRVQTNVRFAVRGLVVAGVTSVVLLGYPLWFTFRGPSHLAGRIWPGLDLSGLVNSLHDYVIPPPQNVSHLFGTALNHLTGGYQGPVLSAQFVGVGALVVSLFGLLAWRRDRRLLLLAVVGACSVGAAVGVGKSLLNDLPLIQDVVAQRYTVVTDFCVAMMLGLTLDHVHRSIGNTQPSPRGSPEVAVGSTRWIDGGRWLAPLVCLLVAAIAIVQPAAYLAQTIPMTAVPVAIPTWFRTVAPHLPPRQTVLVLPIPYAVESPLAWQPSADFQFNLVGGAGPGDVAQRMGREEPGEAVLARARVLSQPAASTRNLAAVRRALVDWGVTLVVIPDQPGLPPYDQSGSVTSSAALITAATGEAPLHQADAWVWYSVDKGPSPPPLSGGQLARCTLGLPPQGVIPVRASTHCVLTALGSASREHPKPD
jgi:hypothetical protein